MMPAELGAWLRQQRQARGWARPEMARQLIRAGQETGDKSMPGLDSMCHNLYRWERGEDSPSERYQLHYCRALGIPPSQFGHAQPDTPGTWPSPGAVTALAAPGIPAAAVPAPGPYAAPGPAGPFLLPSAAIAYGGMQEPATGRSRIEQEVLMGAHEASDHAQQAEQHGIGEATSEQLRADVVRLSHLTDTGEPFAVYLDLRRVRERIYRLLERRLWPREQTDLHFLLGCLNGLMAVCARRLGYPDAAEELSRAGWAHASVIDHRPLLAHLRWQLAYVEWWRGRTRESLDLAASGLEYQSAGPGGAELHPQCARAAARLGDTDAARRAVTAAHEARDRDYHDDLLEIGGDFAVSLATYHCSAGIALAEVPGAESQAAGELEGAIGMYDTGPAQARSTGSAARRSRASTWRSSGSGPAPSTPPPPRWATSSPSHPRNESARSRTGSSWSAPNSPRRSSGPRPRPATSTSRSRIRPRDRRRRPARPVRRPRLTAACRAIAAGNTSARCPAAQVAASSPRTAPKSRHQALRRAMPA